MQSNKQLEIKIIIITCKRSSFLGIIIIIATQTRYFCLFVFIYSGIAKTWNKSSSYH